MQGKLFKPTKGHRDDVMLLVATGMSEEGIAAVIGVQRQTLRKHFALELETGHSKKMAENMKRLDKAAKAGNVTAQKFLAQRIDTLPQHAQPPKPEPIGKKEAAQLDAQTAHEGSEWGNILN